MELTLLLQTTFVGYVRSVNVTSDVNQTIRIEDGTGEISSTLTIEQDPSTDDPQKWRWPFQISFVEAQGDRF